MAPSTLGYAAAATGNGSNGQNASHDHGDWTRKPSANTQTFRRTSLATTPANPDTTRESTMDGFSSRQNSTIPRNNQGADLRYSREELFDMYRHCHEAQDFQVDTLSSLFIGRWDPYTSNNDPRQRRDDGSTTDLCWDERGFDAPLTSLEMTADEKVLFQGSVNAAVKAPQAPSRDASLRDPAVRNNSLLNGTAHTKSNAIVSPVNNRAQRRTDQSETPFPMGQWGQNKDTPGPAGEGTGGPVRHPETRAPGLDAIDAHDQHADDLTPSNQGGPQSPWGNPQQAGFGSTNAFGSFTNIALSAGGIDKRPGFGSIRSESRFKNLMNRDLDGSVTHSHDHSAVTPGNRESDPWHAPTQDGIQENGMRQGLAGIGDMRRTQQGDATADRHGSLSRAMHTQQALSPSNTDPYQPSEAEQFDSDKPRTNVEQLSGLGTFGQGRQHGHHVQNPFGFDPNSQEDRSQNSSAGQQSQALGAISGLGPFTGLGNSSAWGSTHGTTTSSIRGRPGFGQNSVGSSIDLQTTGLAGLGPAEFYNAPNSSATAGRATSRLVSLFGGQDSSDTLSSRIQQPLQSDNESAHHQAAMHALMKDDEYDVASEDVPLHHEVGRLDAYDADSIVSDGTHAQIEQSSLQSPDMQHKTMVMPDRMRWIYRDPQGNTQGPWSGLEMHDWYKAGFFSPELLVKKYEDNEYEPLAQLIRRIGNSREPFLVPQTGIPHGAAATPAWSATNANTSGSQPPFAGNFPSFGTTLTADQQNALERRKQEEQFLMARQKEHLAQQQLAQRLQMQGQHIGLAAQMQLPSQAQSLHLQINGSLPMGTTSYQPSPIQAPGSAIHAPDFYESSMMSSRGNHDSMDRFGRSLEDDQSNPNSLDSRHANPGAQGQQYPQQARDHNIHAQQLQMATDEREHLRQEQIMHDQQNHGSDSFADSARLQEFQDLQDAAQGLSMHDRQGDMQDHRRHVQAQNAAASNVRRQANEPRSLTEQVQQAVSAQQSPQSQSPLAKFDNTVSPIPLSASPLPAPAAQRHRSNVADALSAESQTQSQVPPPSEPADAAAASLAPWARPTETPRGPSLKEIQEVEARKAAQAEALAAEVRRSAAEKEAQLLAQAQAVSAAAAAGLPSTASWARDVPSSTVSTSTPWAKPTSTVSNATTTKSMAQIQKEEEARKRRVAAAATTAQQTALANGLAASATGKRYAELASKGAPGAPIPASGGAWATVGAGGKAKLPPGSTASTTPKPDLSAVAKKAPISRAVSTSTGAANGNATAAAHEALTRWAVNELKHDLDKSVSAEEFVSNLYAFLPDVDIVTEAVHSLSTTIDSRHFAQEFVRRGKMAAKGQFEGSIVTNGAKTNAAGSLAGISSGNGAPGAENAKNSGGWSEVAKKSGKDVAAKDDLSGNFKVVAGKRKGAKR